MSVADKFYVLCIVLSIFSFVGGFFTAMVNDEKIWWRREEISLPFYRHGRFWCFFVSPLLIVTGVLFER